MRAVGIVILVSLVLAAGAAAAQQPALRVASPATAAVAQRASSAPRIDGRDDDAVWQTGRAISDFRQFEPRIGADPSFRTEFRVAFDDRNLFVFVRAYDPHPDSIMRALSRRDVRGPSDQIKIIVDSYNDRRTGFEPTASSVTTRSTTTRRRTSPGTAFGMSPRRSTRWAGPPSSGSRSRSSATRTPPAIRSASA